MQILKDYISRRRVKVSKVIISFAKSPAFLWAWIILGFGLPLLEADDPTTQIGNAIGFPLMFFMILLIAVVADFCASAYHSFDNWRVNKNHS